MDLSPDEDNFQGRLLHQAALWDNVELLQELLTGAEPYAVDARDLSGRTALHAAALADRSRCLRALLQAGAEVDAICHDSVGGKTALHLASERGHVENILCLVSFGAEPLRRDAAGDSALVLAERNGHRHAARALREAVDALERERLSQHTQLRELVSRGDINQLRAQLTALGHSAGIVVNLTPNGANTLLYVASEAGLLPAVSLLLSHGADGRAHPVTKYSPLYIAAYHGHLDIAKMLLEHFPEAVQQETVEKWLPIHAACIGGHANLVTLILEHEYPEHLLSTYTDVTSQWQYKAAFDVNAVDVSGQTALYVACTLGNVAVVDALLNYTVECTRVNGQAEEPPPPSVSAAPPPRAGISLGIHAIVNKLTGAASKKPASSSPARIRCVRVDAGRGGDSCVGCAAQHGHARLLRHLLRAGAAADAAAAAPPDLDTSGNSLSSRARRRSRSASAVASRNDPSPARYGDDRDGPWTALAIAARAKNVQIAELLLTHGATDPHGRALRECVRHGLHELIPAILATKAYPDPEYKLNKSALSEAVLNGQNADSTLTYSALCPTAPVILNWRDLKCNATTLRMSWLSAACARVNPRVCAATALRALTRLDVANNDLRTLPPELFTLISIRYINAAQNKLERLPTPSDAFEDDFDAKGRKVKRKGKRPAVYSAPALQELYLQDNRLEELPACLFSLPGLCTLDVSNNKLRALPASLWTAPQLRDLNAALNHLRDLPAYCREEGVSSPTAPSTPPAHCSNQKSWSRSPSIERSESEAADDGDVPTLGDRAGNAVWSAPVRVHTWRGAVCAGEPGPPGRGGPTSGGSQLSALNLSHNQFSCVPAPLACLAPNLTRLNMAYNSLRSMSYVTSYPISLRQLDLSHNEITCWPSLPQLENFGPGEDPLACYCPKPVTPSASSRRPNSHTSVREQLLQAACPARRHLRLEGLRTLILSNNLLTRIQLTTDDDGEPPPACSDNDNDDDEWNCRSQLKGRLLFPLLSMLDVSCNLLRCVPPAIHELTNLAVLNLSGNKDITTLPPQLGLLVRVWNLSVRGCRLAEPLRQVAEAPGARSAHLLGYLRSVLHEAQPYARMKLMLTGVQGIGKTSLLECLRQESALQHRRKPTEHWAKRMGNKASRRGNMSTVGVDIGTWVYEKHRGSKGPITFRTWDFGGQHEYYATHQYFLSRRSLYLVLWKVTDGRKGLAAAVEWLRSIQARAPGSPVIMVATHYDQVVNSNLAENESPEALQRTIRTCIMGASDADKLGLPRVLDSVEVSCSSRHNIRLLADIIYSVAFSVKPPGSKEPLLEQRVPATYLALEECVTSLAHDLRDPVLRHDDYKRLVTQYMQQKNLRMFRDSAELHQATMFLHENGVLLHYDDATLKELYFLKPQWLCDVLAHVVTVREINPFACNGIMKLDDLAHVFKASPQLARGEEASALGLSLLNKFELALCWDARTLLVPPLLPESEPAVPQLPLRPSSWCSTTRAWPLAAPVLDSHVRTDSPTLVQEHAGGAGGAGGVWWSRRVGGAAALRRVLLVSYVPRGFWARLMARVLPDAALRHARAVPALYTPPAEMDVDESITKALEQSWGWKLWRSGLKLVCGDLTLLTVRELSPSRDALLGDATYGDACVEHEYTDLRLRVKQDGAWCELDVSSSACIEIQLPADVCVVRAAGSETIAGCQSISLEPNPETLAKVLAIISDHVDLLLEDWYPSLGTRFVHTSEGRCLITRVVPCPSCLKDLKRDNVPAEPDLAQEFRRLELAQAEHRPRARGSAESRASDGDSGVGADSNASSRVGSVEGRAHHARVAFGWSVEECIHAACTNTKLYCANHTVKLRDVAPDTLLLDISEDKRARWEHITLGAVCGRGAFGTVLAATWRPPGRPTVQVALKALQPVAPPSSSDLAAIHAYKALLSRWERAGASSACRAYCVLRHELAVMSSLRHPHVLPLLAACPAPLALLLPMAPMGALDAMLRSYQSMGERVRVRCARALALQVARAIEYLHARRIVYRDLKSENVLVWKMPRPAEAAAAERVPPPLDVHVKLADYGISRMAPVSGTKGFGGTEGFMAPEIMRYHGEEEYNEKVDCFSYGMLLYEVVTLRQPFEGHEAVKEAVLDGARPLLSHRDVQYPCLVLETMRRCWAGAPSCRPSAAALVSVCSAPEFVALQDVAACRQARVAEAVPFRGEPESGTLGWGWELWYGGDDTDRVHTLQAASHAFLHHHTIRVPQDSAAPAAVGVTVTAMCRVGRRMWLGDSVGRLTVLDISTCAVEWQVSVACAVGGAASGVSALCALYTLPRVALATDCGRLFLVTSERPMAEGGFVLTELGTATRLHALVALPTPDGNVCVWCAGDLLSVFVAGGGGGGGGVHSADVITSHCDVTLLAASVQHAAVYSYSEGGTCVQQWDGVGRAARCKLDVSKLAPCSESLQTFDDEHADKHANTVSALCSAGGALYVGTADGRVVVADALSLTPLTVFRPHHEQVRAIVPLAAHSGCDDVMIATFGSGYRPLLNRYAPQQGNNSTETHKGYYCMLWRAQHWLPD